MVWILLKPTEIAQKIDLLIKVPDVAPAIVEKMRTLQMCPIKKITPRTTVGTTPLEIQNQSFLSFVLMKKFQYFFNPLLILESFEGLQVRKMTKF